MSEDTARPEVRQLKINKRVDHEVVEAAISAAVEQAVEKKADAFAAVDLIETGPDGTRVVLTGDAPVTSALKRVLTKRYRTAKVVATKLSDEQIEAL